MTKVTYLENNYSAFVHLCPEARHFIGTLALCGRCYSALPGYPCRTEELISSAAWSGGGEPHC